MFTTSIAIPINVSNTLYVSLGGNDSTGTRGRMDRPFASPTAAAAVAQAGDVILVGPGTHDISSLQQGTNPAGTLRLPSGVSLIGSGNPAIPGQNTPAGGFGTIIKSSAGPVVNTDPTVGRGNVINPQGNNCIANLYVQATASGTPAIGANLKNGDTFGSGVVLNNVGIGTVWHGIAITGPASGATPIGTWYLTNCTFTAWDDTIVASSVGNSTAWNFSLTTIACNLTILTSPTLLSPTCYSPRASGITFTDYGSSMTGICISGGYTGQTIAVVNPQGGAIVNLSGTSVTLSGPTLSSMTFARALQASNAASTINVGPGCSYDPTRVLIVTGGFINGVGPWQPPTQKLTESSGAVATNASLGNFFTLAMTANDTLSNPTGMYDGQECTWRINTNGNTLTFGSAFAFGTPGAPTLTSGTNYIHARYNSTTTNWEVQTVTTGF